MNGKLARAALVAALCGATACGGDIIEPTGPAPGLLAEPADPSGDPLATPGDSAAPGDPLPGDPSDPDPGVPEVPTCSVVSPGPAPIRRLTHAEYDRTIRDVLGDDSAPAEAFPPEETAMGFDNNASARTVTPILAERYMQAAEGVAARAALDPDFAALSVDAFFDTVGRRLYRRPLTEDERARYRALHDHIAAEEGHASGLAAIVEVMLQSPHFIYRVEVGLADPAAPGVVALSPWELATRLSYLIWGSAPDEVLLDAAESGQLSTAAEVAAQAERMLEDPRAREAVLSFHHQWLGLSELAETFKDSQVYPGFDEEMKSLLAAETSHFIDHVVFDGEGDLQSLLTADYSFMNLKLAWYYDYELEGEGPQTEAFEQVQLDPARRAGVVTHPAIMAAHAKYNQTSPVLRGKFVREQILCQPLAPPPPDIAVEPPEVDPELTTKERFAQHSTDPACSGCHELMDPLGFAFEHYDGIGRWREVEDGGQPVDANGEIIASEDADAPIDGARDLMQRLAESQQVQRCYVRQWFRFAHGRDVASADGCGYADLTESFVASGGDIKALIVALTQTEAFLYRPEVTQ